MRKMYYVMRQLNLTLCGKCITLCDNEILRYAEMSIRYAASGLSMQTYLWWPDSDLGMTNTNRDFVSVRLA